MKVPSIRVNQRCPPHVVGVFEKDSSVFGKKLCVEDRVRPMRNNHNTGKQKDQPVLPWTKPDRPLSFRVLCVTHDLRDFMPSRSRNPHSLDHCF